MLKDTSECSYSWTCCIKSTKLKLTCGCSGPCPDECYKFWRINLHTLSGPLFQHFWLWKLLALCSGRISPFVTSSGFWTFFFLLLCGSGKTLAPPLQPSLQVVKVCNDISIYSLLFTRLNKYSFHRCSGILHSSLLTILVALCWDYSNFSTVFFYYTCKARNNTLSVASCVLNERKKWQSLSIWLSTCYYSPACD